MEGGGHWGEGREQESYFRPRDGLWAWIDRMSGAEEEEGKGEVEEEGEEEEEGGGEEEGEEEEGEEEGEEEEEGLGEEEGEGEVVGGTERIQGKTPPTSAVVDKVRVRGEVEEREALRGMESGGIGGETEHVRSGVLIERETVGEES